MSITNNKTPGAGNTPRAWTGQEPAPEDTTNAYAHHLTEELLRGLLTCPAQRAIEVLEGLEPKDFFAPQHSVIYESLIVCVRKLVDEGEGHHPVSPVTVQLDLQAKVNRPEFLRVACYAASTPA